MTLGEIVHAYRKEHHLTMQAFADRAGVSKAYVSILEKNVNPKTGTPVTPRVDTFDRLAAALSMTTEELRKKLDGEAPAPEPLAFDPVSALLDANDIRTVARKQIGNATPEQVEIMKRKMKTMIKVMFGEE